ncbi:hypothetical protein [Planobispora longispora]|uniref:Uncharacterized protein n=1 Tax=Planobispora longispora TaxID=28887 RepID=A0A8J3RP43_9ACTN|nr:hypothetical protein [Planobispora longispora]BFE84097.1 hypothetical protein GCM10020093_066980 [Planobispora longispora]GIH78539.1 hypothetical protein Plo01_49680 [Planobispora longispora]
MKRVIKAAVAVAAFGLAAAICSPAQAETADETLDGYGAAGTVAAAIQGLSGGLFDSGAALSSLGSGQGTMTADGVVGTGTDAVERILGVSADNITWGAPARGVSDGTGPVGQTVDSVSGLTGTAADATSSLGRLTDNAQGTAEGAEGLGNQRGAVDGLVHGVNEALPQGPGTGGNLAPAVSAVTPNEVAPVTGAVAPVTGSASIDELAPLVSNTGAQAASSTTGLVDSVADAVDSASRRAATAQ